MQEGTFYLEVLAGERRGQVVSAHNAPFVIGRDPRCDLAFDAQRDLLVSARHCLIARVADGYVLNDTSSNGTYVNGTKVSHHPLSEGDVIELGRGGPRLRFSTLSGQAQTPAARTTLAERQATPIAGMAAASAEPKSTVVPDPDQVQPVIAGPDQRVSVSVAVGDNEPVVFDQPVIRIGRDPSADVSLAEHPLVSHSHAKIVIFDARRATLFDLDSTNGTSIAGARISRRELALQQEVELGQGGPRLRIDVVVKGRAHRQPRQADTLFGGSAPLPALERRELSEVARFALERQQVLVVGREQGQCQVVLDSLYVSKRHATIEHKDGEFQLRDHSQNGTYFSGQRIEQAPLIAGSEFAIGPYILVREGDALVVYFTRAQTELKAIGLRRVTADGRAILDDISLVVPPGRFLCILGPSGCGKSTLLRSLVGAEPMEAGRVELNGIDFFRHRDALRHLVGYVPQDDIIHQQLSVERTLTHAARLRLPPHASSIERQERVDEVMSMLELIDHRDKLVRQLSGGQRKRVSIAVELLTEPALVLLDEPTSGLDPGLEEKMMLLLRELTLRGKTVVAVTHTLDQIDLVDGLIFLLEGKLVYYGTPTQAEGYFSVDKLSEVYKRFAAESADDLKQRFANSPLAELALPAASAGSSKANNRPRPQRTGVLRQFAVLCQRYLETIGKDTRNTLILLLQAPLIALLICLALADPDPEAKPTSTLFLVMSLSALWFGCSSAARELTKERAVFMRERMVNLRILPYVASKVVVLQCFALLQVAMLLVIVDQLRPGVILPTAELSHDCKTYGLIACRQLVIAGVPGSFGQHFLNLYLTALNGIGLGLLASAIARNSDKAMSLVPLLLIPQVLFSGAFGLPQGDQTVRRVAGYAMALNWSLDQGKRNALCSENAEQGAGGCQLCLHGYDPNKHQLIGQDDQLDDRRCASLVGMGGLIENTAESLVVSEDGLYTPTALHKQGPARLAHRSQRGFFVLGGYALLLFALVCITLRWRERGRYWAKQ
ncbi:MAG: FHA domain-containing protein [Deltaproteobacteria bacterium]|nr:FHA domain-containing protein [Deltaproteobacteria bacterium]